MTAFRNIPDQHTLSTVVANERGTYQISIYDGPNCVADADIRPSTSSVDLTIDVTPGHHSPHVRSRLIDAVFNIDEMKPPRTLSATLPIGDVDLLDAVTHHCASVRARAAGSSCLLDGTLRA